MRPTVETTRELKLHLKKSLGLLRALRDEIRIEARLAGKGAKNKLKTFRPRIQEAQKIAHDVGQTSKQLVRDTFQVFKFTNHQPKRRAATSEHDTQA
jgi:hypothetical protein